ncbi:hypothetical protein N7532_000651 [Penicillium argentinense]|uniref:Uncharacterized protein n=1 Tax=Penicillium argentinense TaxID=1131581 RepID=A0A9W9KP19_9EURO|nr:uncharacterized protein N7532_000651 [Penicillium argentinense]KAJ5112606.1 hypothetical protein N7532_000651 [Penicillium argentinense]
MLSQEKRQIESDFICCSGGLVADQFPSMDMVLANGSLMTVDEDSDTPTCDYVIPKVQLWSYAGFIFTHAKVEALYEAINEHQLKNGTQPVDLTNYSVFFNHPDLDPDHSTITFFILHEGIDAVEPNTRTLSLKSGPE